LFFPHVLAGPVIFEKIYLNKNFEQRVIGATVLFLTGMFLLEASSTVGDRYIYIRDVFRVGILVESYLYINYLFGNFFGYSLIAVSYAWLLGLNISYNFNAPGLSTSPKDFWSRWHISLSTFMRTYLFTWLRGHINIKLGLSLTLIISGLWHGLGGGYLIWSVWFVFVALAWPMIASKKDLNSIVSMSVFIILTLPAWYFFGRGSQNLEALIGGIYQKNELTYAMIGNQAAIYIAILTTFYFLPINSLFKLFGQWEFMVGDKISYGYLNAHKKMYHIPIYFLGFFASEGIGEMSGFIYAKF
jgi:alginate O-acetyltransferase complex protein AlgI